MKATALTLAALAVALPPAAASAQEANLLACREIAADAERLACFDALAARIGSGESERQNAKWRVRESTSPIDDSPVVHMMVEAENTVSDMVAGEVHPKLWVTCEGGRAAAYVDWGFTIGGGRKMFEARLDHDEATAANLQISNDFESIGSWNSDGVTAFLARMLDKNLLTVRTTSMSNDPLVAEFDIRGFNEAVGPLREACAW